MPSNTLTFPLSATNSTQMNAGYLYNNFTYLDECCGQLLKPVRNEFKNTPVLTDGETAFKEFCHAMRITAEMRIFPILYVSRQQFGRVCATRM